VRGELAPVALELALEGGVVDRRVGTAGHVFILADDADTFNRGWAGYGPVPMRIAEGFVPLENQAPSGSWRADAAV
jgi:hypothetical protein